MKISSVLSKNLIISNLVSRTKKDVLDELVSKLVKYEERISKEELLRALVEREELGSTGIDNGVAIPHCKFKNIDTTLMAFGRSRGGIDFGALDGNLSYFFFLVVAPENSVGHHLSALSCISHLARSRRFRKHCMEVTSNHAIYQLIQDEEDEILKQTV